MRHFLSQQSPKVKSAGVDSFILANSFAGFSFDFRDTKNVDSREQRMPRAVEKTVTLVLYHLKNLLGKPLFVGSTFFLIMCFSDEKDVLP